MRRSFLRISVVIAITVAWAAPAFALPTNVKMPADEEVVECFNLTSGGDSFFVQCGEAFAGTMVPAGNGSYSGLLVCKYMELLPCEESVLISLPKSYGSPKGHSTLDCVFHGAANATSYFSCKL